MIAASCLARWLVLALALAPLLAACSGDDDGPAPPTVDATAIWARGVCASFDQWSADVEALASDVEAQPAPPDTAAAREAAIAFVDALLDETDDLVTALGGLPAPSIEDGGAIAAAVVAVAVDMRTSLRDARGTLTAAPPDDREAFVAALGEVREALAGAQADAGAALSQIAAEYDTAELSSILSRAPECASPD